MRISLTSIHVDNPGKAFKFYTEVLGFKERMYVPVANLAIVAAPNALPGVGLLLEPSDNQIAQNYMEGLRRKGHPAIVLSVEDIQKEYERLKEAGVVFKKEPAKTDWGFEAIFDDTCGNWIQLAQMQTGK